MITFLTSFIKYWVNKPKSHPKMLSTPQQIFTVASLTRVSLMTDLHIKITCQIHRYKSVFHYMKNIQKISPPRKYPPQKMSKLTWKLASAVIAAGSLLSFRSNAVCIVNLLRNTSCFCQWNPSRRRRFIDRSPGTIPLHASLHSCSVTKQKSCVGERSLEERSISCETGLTVEAASIPVSRESSFGSSSMLKVSLCSYGKPCSDSSHVDLDPLSSFHLTVERFSLASQPLSRLLPSVLSAEEPSARDFSSSFSDPFPSWILDESPAAGVCWGVPNDIWLRSVILFFADSSSTSTNSRLHI